VIASNNRSESNTGFGIRLQNGAANNLVEKNEVFHNTQDGIELENDVDGNQVQVNFVRGNGRDGIRVGDTLSADNMMERNQMRMNTEHDAHDDSVGPGTGGTANFWIKNHCEIDNRLGSLCHPDDDADADNDESDK